MREYLRVIAEIGPNEPLAKYAEAAGRTTATVFAALRKLVAWRYVYKTPLPRNGHSYALTAKGAREVAR